MAEQRTTSGHVSAEEVLDGLPAVVAVCDAALRCRYANAAAVRWFGRSTAEEVLDRSLRDLLPAEVYAIDLPHARAALAGVPQRFSRTFVDRDGEPRQADVRYVPHVQDSAVTGFLVHAVDTTDQVRAGAAFRREAVSAALAGERDRIAAAVGELIGRRLHGATLEVSAALQSGAVAVEDRLHAALHHLDAAVKEARRLVHPVPLTSPAPEDERDRELRRTRVLLDQLLVARSAHRPHLGRRPVDRVPHR